MIRVVTGAAAALMGCASGPRGTPVGISDAVPERAAAASPRAVQTPSPEFFAAQTWPEAAPAVVALVHHRDGTLIRVRVEPAALAAYGELAVDSPMPDGARVMAWHEASGGGVRGAYLLEKRAGAWRAAAFDAQGVRLAGDGATCLRCHQLAPADHLFGVGSRAPAPRATPEGIDRAGSTLTPSN